MGPAVVRKCRKAKREAERLMKECLCGGLPRIGLLGLEGCRKKYEV
jgi:hypothetical protein